MWTLNDDIRNRAVTMGLTGEQQQERRIQNREILKRYWHDASHQYLQLYNDYMEVWEGKEHNCISYIRSKLKCLNERNNSAAGKLVRYNTFI